ncbi:hypothetical protein NDI56_09595 [Haloarcula sp. S1CR25-12]|uniref:DUF6199 domain-containing protein n=1 Tax=Haloarcula saliterrae TaxID=2950534 RepID=A0ABU2FBL7_9EURY|nr:hypothetical protein [Haloarcula sp. S1CR25-12]MDS0259644.1 hypothetical protein [Haloarcula sp. S1CR25-12]
MEYVYGEEPPLPPPLQTMTVRSSHTTRYAVAFVALLLTVPTVAHAGAATVAPGQAPPSPPTSAAAPEPGAFGSPAETDGFGQNCTTADEPTRLVDDPSDYSYVDGLSGRSTADWTDGEPLRIGAAGDCSLGVGAARTATLTAATVDPNRGRVTGMVDVGRDGALRFVQRTDANATAAVAVENVGRENSDRLAVVVTNETGATTYRERFTAPSGRFVAFDVRWYPDGTVHVTLWDTERARPDRVTAAVEAGDGNASWAVRLDGRAYLDEIGVGTHESAETDGESSTATGRATAPADEAETDDMFPIDPDSVPENDPPDRSEDTANGLAFGPLLAIGGALSYRYAYQITRISEQLDAIGSTTRASEVEPAEWNVAVTKVLGAAGVVFGVGWLLVSIL